MQDIELSDLKKVIGTENILVDFWAPWCGPCKLLTPVLEEVAKKLGNKVRIVKVNIDTYPEVSRSYGVKTIPTMLLFKAGGGLPVTISGRNVTGIVTSIEGNL
jgi:thioredoxin 1